MVSLCKIKIKNAFLSLRVMQKYLALVEMMSPVLLGHNIKRKGGCSDSDHKLHFSIILCTGLIKIQLLPRVWRCYTTNK